MATRTEAQREFDRSSDIGRIMSMFGVKDYDYNIKSDAWDNYLSRAIGGSQARGISKRFDTLEELQALKTAQDEYDSGSAIGDGVFGNIRVPDTSQEDKGERPGSYQAKTIGWDSDDEYVSRNLDANELLENYYKYNVDPNELISEAEKNFALNEGRYAKTKGDVVNYFSDTLGRKTRDTSRNLGFALARRGQTGGSQAIDKSADLARVINEENVNLDANAQEASNAARRYDNQLREQLVSQVNDDTRAKTLTATTADDIALNASRAFDQSKMYEAGRLLDEFSNLNQLGSFVKGRNQANVAGFNPEKYLNTTSKSYYGSTS